MQYGYIRVSSKEQNEDRQVIAMDKYGGDIKRIYIDKQSGKDFERPAYKKMLRTIKADDVIVVKSIDRLGRNYEEILEQWRIITKEKRASIVVLDMPLLDTRRIDNNLTSVFIADLVLQILSYVAETERENIKSRQAEGIAAARAKGVHLGRPAIEQPENYGEVKKGYLDKIITSGQAADRLGISKTTFIRWVKNDLNT